MSASVLIDGNFLRCVTYFPEKFFFLFLSYHSLRFIARLFDKKFPRCHKTASGEAEGFDIIRLSSSG